MGALYYRACSIISSATLARARGGILGAAAIGLVTYMVSVGNVYPHPMHWLTSGIGMLAGYRIGIAVWSPRAKCPCPRSNGKPGSQAFVRSGVSPMNGIKMREV